jgi:uncharacterized membrane protein
MNPAIRIVFAVIGAFLCSGLGRDGDRLLDWLLGGCAGFALADLWILRARLRDLEGALQRQQAILRRSEPAASAGAATAPRVPSPPPAPIPPPAPVPPPAPPAGPAPPAATGARAPSAAPRPMPAGPDAYPEAPLVAALRRFFTGGNVIVRVGVVVLFFGVAFLLRYVAEHSRIPIEARLSGVALGALVLLGLGWRLRIRRAGYGLALQGGAIGILYLTVFAALRLYAVLPAGAAFALLVLIAALSAALAIMQDSLAFAFLGVSGGFLAPVLASTGHGSHVVLFSYYAVLNAGILAVAWFKAWRPLNLAGFVFTFGIGTVWGVLQYRPEDFASTEPFLLAFFLFYVGIAVLFTLRQPLRLQGYVDGTIVFGTPLAAFGLQAAMLQERLFALAYSAVAFSALYLSIAALLQRRRRAADRVLIESFLALGVVFLTLAVPLALDSRWNSTAWALEGAALTWIGCRQNRVLPRLAGVALVFAAGCVLAGELDIRNGRLTLPWGAALCVLTVAGAAVFSARMLRVSRERLQGVETSLEALLCAWGLLWWVIGGLAEMTHVVPPEVDRAATLGFLTVTALVCGELHRRLDLAAARIAARLLLPVMLLSALLVVPTPSHPFAAGGWIAWPLAFATFYWLTHRDDAAVGSRAAGLLHVPSAWLLCTVLGWELSWCADRLIRGGVAWSAAGWALAPMALLTLLPRLATRVRWPFMQHRGLYLSIVGSGLVLFLVLWSAVANLACDGDAAPLPYVPLLNPLDLMQAFVLLALWRYRPLLHPRVAPAAPLAGLGFLWVNGVLLRTLHHWTGVPYRVSALLESNLVETALSICWTILALVTMLVAVRRRSRTSWIAGAALLGVVIAKLFLVDLSNSGSIERIVSFVAVGLLIMVIGFFSPIPPLAEERK